MIKVHESLEKEELLEQSEQRRPTLRKANLRYEEGENGEGIWVLPCTPADVALMDDDTSVGESVYAWLCNNPLCPDVQYGSKVEFVSNGKKRPYSREIASSAEQYDAMKERLMSPIH